MSFIARAVSRGGKKLSYTYSPGGLLNWVKLTATATRPITSTTRQAVSLPSGLPTTTPLLSNTTPAAG